MTDITSVDAIEVLDSRGHPTVRVTIESAGQTGTFTVPAGASTGAHEAHERRDGDTRYRGRGVQSAIDAIHGEIADTVCGFDVRDQRGLDETLRKLDGTPALERLGANAILGVSGATLHTACAVTDQAPYEYLGTGSQATIPMPMVNLISGGAHATGGMAIQDILLIPTGADSFTAGLATCWEIRQTLRDQLSHDGHRPLVADEGGFAPPFDAVEDALAFVCASIEGAGYVPGTDVTLGIDMAASEFYDPNHERYYLKDTSLTATELINRIRSWIDRYPLTSIEDPLAEDDWDAWNTLYHHLPSTIQLIGDDLIATNPDRLDRARSTPAANAVLIKPNQAGTITRTMEVLQRGATNGLNTIVSARSGETCDTTIADLAVGLDAGQIKIGSLARSERLAKYNRLLEINAHANPPYASYTPPTMT